MVQNDSTISREFPARRPSFVALKRCVQFVFCVLVLPRLAWHKIGEVTLGVRAFSGASESIAKIPGMRGVYSRQAFYRRTLQACGLDCYFGWNSVFSMREAQLGDRVYIGRFCSLGYAQIESDSMLADGVQVLSGGREHGTDETEANMHDQGQSYCPVRIGHACWIGANAVIMADVGANSIVGAGAVVNKPIPKDSVAVGVPARVVKRRGAIANTNVESVKCDMDHS